MDIYNGVYARRKSYAKIPEVHATPHLIEVQLRSFRWFMEEGLRELFDEVTPIQSFDGHLELSFLDHHFEEPRYGEDECRERDMTYAAPLRVRVRLLNKQTGEIPEQEVFMGDFPLMTSKGTFIINGAERVVVSQLIRSPGAYFTLEEERVSGRQLCMAKLIPDRGAWLEFETNKRDVLSVKVDRRRKFPVTELLRAALGLDQEDKEQCGKDEDLLRLFAEVESSDPEHRYIAATIEREATKNAAEALLDMHRKLRPGEPPTPENAARYLHFLLFDARHYDLGRVGRYKLNKRLGASEKARHLTLSDLTKIVETMIRINNRLEGPDDIDHLGNRRIKTVGELIQNQLRIGLLRLERVVRERMSTRETQGLTPLILINVRPIVAILRQFFGGSQLSQFMDQTNPLAELNHKRRVSALGPGGLRRERAGFDVRDVHHSHYGRICPIETPEGPNIGLIGALATYARVNDYGFIETPYRRVVKAVPNEYGALLGATLSRPVAHPETGEKVAEAGLVVGEELARRLAALPPCQIPIRPRVTDEIVYLTADEEDRYHIAQANSLLNERGEFVEERVSVRYQQQFMTATLDKVDFMDVSPKQAVGVSAALIPFLEHDDANRALMGANMQRQAVPLLHPDGPIVGTGMEFQAALDSGQLVIAKKAGEVLSATSRRIVIDHGDEIASYHLVKYRRSNQSTCISQRPVVSQGDWVEAGQVIADSFSTEEGLLALGQDVLVAFMLWEAGNFEDAVVVSESLIWKDKFTSVHIEEHELESRDTKLGPEDITRDIPNVGEDALRDLDESGVIRIGASVFPGDILVGKITPKGEAELTPEEKLLRAIFGEKAREVRDSSLRLPHGEKGKVVDIRTFTREDHPDLPVGVERMVRVSIAERRKLTEGDKMAGRHGNKGVISKVVPVQDMPYLADGMPVEIILNPLGVPSRMNIGQVFETHLGWAANSLGFKILSPVFDGADEMEIAAELARSWLMEQAWAELTARAWEWVRERGYSPEEIQDDEEVRLLYLGQALPEASEEVLGARSRARRAFLQHWLAEQGYDFDQLFVLEGDGRSLSERQGSDRKVIEVCLRLWMEHHGFETGGLSSEKLLESARKASQESGWPLPISGKTILYDGKTGQPFDLPVTVGIINMMKLDHLVEDKVHARSTGPYSLVTQQPLGGKAQFGGQRFGEMEVWALEAYGAAHILQEMLTVKSDDVDGRTRTYEAIVKGEEIQGPGIPESFNVLVKELQSLGLAVEVMDEEGQKVELGRKETEAAVPKFGLGLI